MFSIMAIRPTEQYMSTTSLLFSYYGNDCPSNYVYIHSDKYITASPLKVEGKKLKSAYKSSGSSGRSLSQFQ